MKTIIKILTGFSIVAVIAAVIGICFINTPWKYEPAQEATCESAGHTGYYKRWFMCCKDRDGKELIDESETIIPALGHDLNEVSAVAATCTEDGNVHYFHCKNCERNFSDRDCKTQINEVTVSATGHVEDSGEITQEPTCTTMGETTYYCMVCGAECKTVTNVPVKPHTYLLSETYWTENGYSAPTENSNAVIPYTCTVCHQNFVSEWSAETFSFAENGAVRIEDKYHAGTAVMFDDLTGYLIINLSGSSWSDTLKSLQDEEYYDPATRVLTVGSARGISTVKSVKIIGRTASISEFAIAFGTFNTLPITLQNLSYVAPDGYAGLYLGSIQTVTLEIVGSVSITGGKGHAGIEATVMTIYGNGGVSIVGGDGDIKPNFEGQNGGEGISAHSLILRGPINYHIDGGKGGDGSNGANGGKGGVAITAQNISIDDPNLFISLNGGKGGTGGTGVSGTNGTPGKDAQVGGDAGTGGIGGKGGDGGLALSANDVFISASKCVFTGGDGGQGGVGGEGGCGGDSLAYDSFVISTGTIVLKGGRGGNGGEGGTGGQGGEGGTNNWAASKGGVGGQGGRGGSPGSFGLGGKNAEIFEAYNSGMIQLGPDATLSFEIGEDGSYARAGHGGKGGVGGPGPSGTQGEGAPGEDGEALKA